MLLSIKPIVLATGLLLLSGRMTRKPTCSQAESGLLSGEPPSDQDGSRLETRL